MQVLPCNSTYTNLSITLLVEHDNCLFTSAITGIDLPSARSPFDESHLRFLLQSTLSSAGARNPARSHLNSPNDTDEYNPWMITQTGQELMRW